jgi:hypothetical protein
MTNLPEQQELKDRLSLIENMIAEGRQSTASWGWTFVLWGVAYYVAIAWAYFGNPTFAWPVTMVVAGLITGIVASRKADSGPETTLGRSMISVWLALGISLFVFGISAGIAGHTPQQVFVAVISVMLGMANATSSLILRWKAQFGCAIVWWSAAIVSLFGSVTTSSIAFLSAIFLCQIVFGVYMMISEARDSQFKMRKQSGSHA